METIFQDIAYKDIWQPSDIKDVHFANLTQTQPQLAEFLASTRAIKESHYYYLVFMAVRLLECHRILKDTGSLYLHCDPGLNHYLKLLLIYIFSEDNCRAEIVWQRKRESGGQ